jgi:YhfZ C-terminal domain/Helix-turn-helix domain
MSTHHVRTHARALTEVVPELARRFLIAPEPPARLPTIRDLAREHRSSLASIHAAIGRLEEADAITIETRGRLGAFMVQRSLGRLWSTAEGGPLVIGLPLASSSRYEALATAIKQLLTSAGIEVFLIFVRGSRQRLQAVREGRCHLTAMSSFASAELCGPDDAVIVELGPDSYNTGHRVFYRAENPDPHPIRVIVDRHSADQQLLTALEFDGPDVTLIPAMPAQISRLLASGGADAAVWTIDEMEVGRPDGILDRPLQLAVRQKIGDRMTRAVLVGRAADAALMRVVTAPIQSAAVAQIQLDVMAGRVVPEY